MFAATQKLGAVQNDGAETIEIEVPPYVLVGGAGAVRPWIAWNVGGVVGAEAAWVVSSFAATRSLKRLRLRVCREGAVEVDYQPWTAAAA